jgi:hypothetical protein
MEDSRWKMENERGAPQRREGSEGAKNFTAEGAEVKKGQEGSGDSRWKIEDGKWKRFRGRQPGEVLKQRIARPEAKANLRRA